MMVQLVKPHSLLMVWLRSLANREVGFFDSAETAEHPRDACTIVCVRHKADERERTKVRLAVAVRRRGIVDTWRAIGLRRDVTRPEVAMQDDRCGRRIEVGEQHRRDPVHHRQRRTSQYRVHAPLTDILTCFEELLVSLLKPLEKVAESTIPKESEPVILFRVVLLRIATVGRYRKTVATSRRDAVAVRIVQLLRHSFAEDFLTGFTASTSQLKVVCP